MPVEEWQVPLWDAINRYVETCGGDPGKRVYGNTRRMRAVSEVCDLVRKIEKGLHLDPVAQAKERVKAMGDVIALQRNREELLRQLGYVNAAIEKFKVKCATCRCRILPWEKCRCCAEPACMQDEPLI